VKIEIITLFPGMVAAPLAESIVGRARARGIVDIAVRDLRAFAPGRHQVTDEPPFGGGGGMVLKPEPLALAIDAVRGPGSRVVLLDPAGRRFTQDVAREMARVPHLVLVCGRYEGVDGRVGEHLVDEELSIGDYVLSGGELAALVVTEAARPARASPVHPARDVPGLAGAGGPDLGRPRADRPLAPRDVGVAHLAAAAGSAGDGGPLPGRTEMARRVPSGPNTGRSPGVGTR